MIVYIVAYVYVFCALALATLYTDFISVASDRYDRQD